MMDLMMQYLKYLLEGLAVAAAAYFIPKRKTSLNEVAMIALTAAATFAVLDLFAPAVGSGARHGAGFGIGARHVGFGAEGFKSKNVSDGEEAAEKFDHHMKMEEEPAEKFDHHMEMEEEVEEEEFNVEGFSGF